MGIEIEAPKCDNCGFNDCIKHITEYDALCSNAIARQKYESTEVSEGVPFLPTVLSVNVPFGLFEEIRTCYTCGPTTITAPITQPATEPQSAPSKGPSGRAGHWLESSPGHGSGPSSGSSSGSRSAASASISPNPSSSSDAGSSSR
ncbi:hypothetical protein CGRA01v4_04171 [Colletotrichum graminicola]|uniref:Uncharacterized protein n=1 Tax=Colletotrichum graminicola (strain M1.001 / M2 / FGSC 10212) TaxID=645133 RepID=E3QVL8_COLGM|nr:uncharacterized protein GLRG_10050 [Colletotrichum graminicola M1.001]EFQ34906.1 hypothetical protein GLRG_10050 [Colletotrichum graminicola M1.001]WDK12890.1 hypothetical protein CGRA01v4_04171 [Colletotrichum graminicola]